VGGELEVEGAGQPGEGQARGRNLRIFFIFELYLFTVIYREG